MNTVFILCSLLFVAAIVGAVIRIHTLTLMVGKDPKLRREPNPMERDYLLIKGLY